MSERCGSPDQAPGTVTLRVSPCCPPPLLIVERVTSSAGTHHDLFALYTHTHTHTMMQFSQYKYIFTKCLLTFLQAALSKHGLKFLRNKSHLFSPVLCLKPSISLPTAGGRSQRYCSLRDLTNLVDKYALNASFLNYTAVFASTCSLCQANKILISLSHRLSRCFSPIVFVIHLIFSDSLFITLPVCRECLGEAHEPCDCQMWRNWLQKVTEMKPEECKSAPALFPGFLKCYWGSLFSELAPQ